MNRFLKGAVLGSAALLITLQGSVDVAQARDFDVTGTLECGVRSGERCSFADWANGPTIAVLTEDISGETQRVLLDASWVKDDLSSFDQDDWVWFTVREGLGPNLKVVGIVERRCKDGTYNPGLSTASKCVRENGDTDDDDDDDDDED